MFISHLGIAGDALAAADLHPLTQVHAVIVYTVETEPAMPSQSRELVRIKRRHILAAKTAFSRLRESAAAKGADGVVGLQITRRILEANVCEWSMVGTAVRTPLNARHPLFLTTLSGLEYHVLIRNGFRPVATAFGLGIYAQRKRPSIQRKLNIGCYAAKWQQSNGERRDYTDGLTKARRLAMSGLAESVAGVSAEGIVGIHLEYENDLRNTPPSQDGCVLTVTATGTAIMGLESRRCAIIPAVPLSVTR